MAGDHSSPWLPYGGRGHADPIPGTAALRITGLRVTYPGPVVAVDGVDLTLSRGECLALVGPNGCGKSSLLRAIIGVAPIAGGTISVFGNPVGACRHGTAYLPQLSEIDWGFPISVRGLVMQGRDVHLGWFGRRTAADNAAVDDALERTGMSGLADRPAESLSGGQRQRALLGRALAQNAELLLLDEPLTALDQENRNAITSVIDDLLARGGAVLMSTHHIDDARAAGYDIVTMNAGRVEHAAAAQT